VSGEYRHSAGSSNHPLTPSFPEGIPLGENVGGTKFLRSIFEERDLALMLITEKLEVPLFSREGFRVSYQKL
jgi:hypothetical protein